MRGRSPPSTGGTTMGAAQAERTPSQLVGARVRRLEDPRFLTGRGRYLDDIRVPGMLEAAVLRSPHAHARIVSIDAGRALARPGVFDVVTGAEIRELARPQPVIWRIIPDQRMTDGLAL